MFNIGDRVQVSKNLQLQFDEEEKLIGELGIITFIDDYTFPYRIKLDNENLENIYKNRNYDEFDLKKV